MTIQNIVNFIDYVGNGAQTSFVFNFRVADAAWVDINFTDNLSGVALNIDQDLNPGGSVDYSIAPPASTDIHIQRITPLTQETDYARHDPFDSETNEDNLDKLTSIIQDLSTSATLVIGDELWNIVSFAGDRTLQLADKSAMLRSTGMAPTPVDQTITIPLDSNIDHAVGTQITIYQKGTAPVVWVAEGAVVINTPAGSGVSRRYATVTFVKEGPDEWMVAGEVIPL